MSRPKHEKKKDLQRIQFDLTPERVLHLQSLQESMKTASYRDTVEGLIKLGNYIEGQLDSGATTLDLCHIKALCFS